MKRLKRFGKLLAKDFDANHFFGIWFGSFVVCLLTALIFDIPWLGWTSLAILYGPIVIGVLVMIGYGICSFFGHAWEAWQDSEE